MNKIEIADSLPADYNPLSDKTYMSPYMLRYFRDKLENELKEVLDRENGILYDKAEELNRQPDFVDQGAIEGLRFQDFILQEHDEEHRKEIEDAFERINNGTYGFCEETGEAIGVQRLLSLPTAKYTAEVQARLENTR